MSLTRKIFNIFFFIFVAQILVIGAGSFYLYSSKNDKYPLEVLNSLTKIDQAIVEGVILQNKLGSTLARDLISYKLLELNNIDSVEFLRPAPPDRIIFELMLRDCIIYQKATVCINSKTGSAVSLIPLILADEKQGYLKLEKSLGFADKENEKLLLTIGLTVMIVFLINLFTLFMIWWKFLRPETSMLLKVFETAEENPNLQVHEYKMIQNSFLGAIKEIKKKESEEVLLKYQLQKFNLATQVAHDIRSPLEVLKGLKSELGSLPESSRRIIQLSINRIEEIAYNLLKNNRDDVLNDLPDNSENLLALIVNLIIEKRYEFRDLNSVNIIENFNESSLRYFSVINRSMLKSIISNLINNSVDAFCNRGGTIQIDLSEDNNFNVVVIADNGEGIHPEIVKEIFIKGFTTKTHGNGLGLYNAKKSIEAAGGRLEFVTSIGTGTTFKIFLPKALPPATFVELLDISKYSKVIILDDDVAFHEIWKRKFYDQDIVVEHIFSIKQIFSSYENLDSDILFLCDYELMDSEYNGIEVIKKYQKHDNCILVTARSEEAEIRENCLQNNIKILPKNLVNFISIKNSKSVAMDTLDSTIPVPVILIDDDRLIRLNWLLYCQKNGLNFFEFETIEEFINSSSSHQIDSLIFIDSNLKNGIKGEVESEKIFKLGFRNLYLSTGYLADSIDKPDWIKMVCSKNPNNIKFLIENP